MAQGDGRNGRQSNEETPLIIPPGSEVTPDVIEDAEEGAPKHDGPKQSVGTVRAVFIILSLWVLIFLQACNMSGLSTTQSVIAADLDAYADANWFNSAFLIASSSVSPLAGRLSQIFSPRTCIFASSIGFAIGTLIVSQAPSLAVFLIGRAVTGIGAAGIMTLSMILVLELTGKKRRGLFIGLVNTGYTSGVALGAIIAGAAVPVTGWRALFWMQTPLALVAGIGVFLSIPTSFVTSSEGGKQTLMQKLAKVDYIGAVLLTSSIVLFLYGLSTTIIEWIPIIISVILLVLFVINGLYWAEVPIIPITILKSHGALLTALAQLGSMAARWLVLFYSPVYELAVRGWSPASAGSVLIFTNLGFASGGLLAGALHINRAGSFYIPSLLCYFMFSASLFTLSTLANSESSPAVFMLVLFINGLFTGAALNYTLAHMLHLTIPSTHFIATSLLATFRGFAGSFGSAIGGGFFVRTLQASLEKGFREKGVKGEEDLIRRLLGGPAIVSTLTGVEKEVAIGSYVTAFETLFFAGSAFALLVVVIQACSGWKEPVEHKTINEDVEHED